MVDVFMVFYHDFTGFYGILLLIFWKLNESEIPLETFCVACQRILS
jgi:hypothetical protein